MIEVGEKHRQRRANSFLAGAGRDINALCASYRRFYLPVLKAMNDPADALSARVLFVRYEQLIGDTEAAVQRLSAFCDLSLTSADLAAWGKRRRQASSSDDPLLRHPHWSAYITGLSGGPISGARISRHREVLATSEAYKIEQTWAAHRQAFVTAPPTPP